MRIFYLSMILLITFLLPFQIQAQAPTGSSPQTFCEGDVIADLVAIGDTIQWYEASTGGNPLDTTNVLVDGQFYYASQMVSGVESTDRLEVEVIINFVTGGIIADDQVLCFEASPDPFIEISPATGTSLSYQWSFNVTDPPNFNAIVGATEATYYPSSTAILNFVPAIFYRRTTTSTLNGVACVAESNILKIENDNISPTFTAPDDVTVNCGADLSDLTITGNITDEEDNCVENLNITYSDTTDSTNPCALIITRTWSLTDGSGNTTSHDQIITVVDNETPTFTRPSDITICENDIDDLMITGDVIDEADNCVDSLNATYSDVIDSISPCNILITRTWSLSDDCGNTTTYDQIITVADNDAPIILGSIIPTNIAGCDTSAIPIAAATVAELEALLGNLTITDGCCADSNISVSHVDVSIGTCPIVVVRTYSLTDKCGNISEDIIHIINLADSQVVLTETACDSFELNGVIYTQSGTYVQYITNDDGSSSTLTLYLTINEGSETEITETVCDFYTLNGETYTESGTYTQSWPNAVGCDSTLILYLTVNKIDNTVTQDTVTLTAGESDATYQWLDCDNNLQPIAGETNQSFTPTVNGAYAVLISKNGCESTSYCYAIISIDILEMDFAKEIMVYPNPTNKDVTIDLGQVFSKVNIQVKNFLGQSITDELYGSAQKVEIKLPTVAGVYFIQINADGKNALLKIIKK